MTKVTQEAPPTIEISDLEQFVKIMAGWHVQKVNILQHMLEVPDGTEMIVGDESPTRVILTGDMLAGFKAGIELSLIELGTLPFVYETTDV